MSNFTFIKCNFLLMPVLCHLLTTLKHPGSSSPRVGTTRHDSAARGSVPPSRWPRGPDSLCKEGLFGDIPRLSDFDDELEGSAAASRDGDGRLLLGAGVQDSYSIT